MAMFAQPVGTWDFSPVCYLSETLGSPSGSEAATPRLARRSGENHRSTDLGSPLPKTSIRARANEQGRNLTPSLGDFAGFWQELGTPELSTSQAPPTEHTNGWQESDAGSRPSTSSSGEGRLTKNQRKKANKKANKAAKALKAKTAAVTSAHGAEETSPKATHTTAIQARDNQKPQTQTGHLKSKTTETSTTTELKRPAASSGLSSKQQGVRSHTTAANPVTLKNPENTKPQLLVPSSVLSPRTRASVPIPAPTSATPQNKPKQPPALSSYLKGSLGGLGLWKPHPRATPPKVTKEPITAQTQTLTSTIQTSTTSLPVAVQRPASSHNTTSPHEPITPSETRPSLPTKQRSENDLTTKTRKKYSIEPTTRSGADRHLALYMKLLHGFFEDRATLVSPMNLTTHNNDPAGIHIFVDASNIFIGFMDQLKRSRGIPHFTKVPEVNLSFDALALLMERRRPVAKRVLVGSTPHVPAFDTAKAVGYECSILEKVLKARELTERQKFFKDLDAGRLPPGAKAPQCNSVALVARPSAAATSAVDGIGKETSTVTTSPRFASPKMIEQGVDEILHLKILESVVDTEVPSTIVLATGDAAAAEYSQGFMATAERALKKGWSVELVSWSKNINSLYHRSAWSQAWGKRFRIITLDDYAEELLDM